MAFDRKNMFAMFSLLLKNFNPFKLDTPNSNVKL